MCFGRNTLWPMNYGAKSSLSFDMDDRTIKAAKTNLEKYKLGRFDIIYVHFISTFTKKYNSTLLGGRLSRNSRRINLGKTLNTWFKKYWNQFKT